MGIKEFAKLKNLDLLSLGRTPLTDAGLKEVATLTGLQRLSVDHTEVSRVGEPLRSDLSPPE